MRKSILFITLYSLLTLLTYTAANAQVQVVSNGSPQSTMIEGQEDGQYEFTLTLSAKAATTIICGRINSKTTEIIVSGNSYPIERLPNKDDDGNRYIFNDAGYKNTTDLRKAVRTFVRKELGIQ